ncbi:hypothetical protein O181_016277 [Austropuccinia psidii MF-1]|uniref:Uncharacterized protein n=1 Tax=Austropuccinia psidii MF-1 TaxID=1389203 RepID=A0A9Q3GRI8_9BASI|nr:hypothetical protein [Austropuccinia psidii MF-1]
MSLSVRGLVRGSLAIWRAIEKRTMRRAFKKQRASKSTSASIMGRHQSLENFSVNHTPQSQTSKRRRFNIHRPNDILKNLVFKMLKLPTPSIDLELHPVCFEPSGPNITEHHEKDLKRLQPNVTHSPFHVGIWSNQLARTRFRKEFSDALVKLRAYKPHEALLILNHIEAPSTSREKAKLEEALSVGKMMNRYQDAINNAWRLANWQLVLRSIVDFENYMYFKHERLPRRGFRFPLPRSWLFLACEAFAYLGRHEPAYRVLNELLTSFHLSPAEQAWLGGLLAYSSGRMRIAISYWAAFAHDPKASKMTSVAFFE